MSKETRALGLSSALGKDDRVFLLSTKVHAKNDPIIPTIYHASRAMDLSETTLKSYPKHKQSDFSLYDNDKDKWIGNSEQSHEELNEWLIGRLAPVLKEGLEKGKIVTMTSAINTLHVPRYLVLNTLQAIKMDLFDNEKNRWILKSGATEDEAVEAMQKRITK